MDIYHSSSNLSYDLYANKECRPFQDERLISKMQTLYDVHK